VSLPSYTCIHIYMRVLMDGPRAGKEVGRNVLFFGCRDPAHDFLYKAELESYVASGDLELHTAFSRTQACWLCVSGRARARERERERRLRRA
jgi:sulfite reductase alpha subunit-like flavoprotein